MIDRPASVQSPGERPETSWLRRALDASCFAILMGLAAAGAALVHAYVAFPDTSLEGRAALGLLSAMSAGSLSAIASAVLYPICFEQSDLSHVSRIVAGVAVVALGGAFLLRASGSASVWTSGVFAIGWAVFATVREARRTGSVRSGG